MKKKNRLGFPAYTSLVGAGSEIKGTLSFAGGLHVDGHIIGDVSGGSRKSDAGTMMTVSSSGLIEGNLTVPHVVIDGTVIGDVRAEYRAVLASGARIQGTVYYGSLEMDEGAEVNGHLVHIDAGGGRDPSKQSAVAVGATGAESATPPGRRSESAANQNRETDGVT
jgi:cytoskeletal protein CcmA (bactofilin family)